MTVAQNAESLCRVSQPALDTVAAIEDSDERLIDTKKFRLYRITSICLDAHTVSVQKSNSFEQQK